MQYGHRHIPHDPETGWEEMQSTDARSDDLTLDWPERTLFCAGVAGKLPRADRPASLTWLPIRFWLRMPAQPRLCLSRTGGDSWNRSSMLTFACCWETILRPSR